MIDYSSKRMCRTLGVRPAAIAACALGVAGCGASGGVPLAESEPPASVAEYKIGPGDTLDVFVWNNPDISATVPVRPDGKISTPLVEDMVAVGKAPSELARDMEKVLADYIRSPKVNIIVTEFFGTFGAQIRVVGQAAEPQALSYRHRMTLLDVMIEVGGLTEFAAGNRAKVIRWVDGEQVEIAANLKDLLDKDRKSVV